MESINMVMSSEGQDGEGRGFSAARLNGGQRERVHIGNLIATALDVRGISKAEFGRRINMSRQNVNAMLDREGVDSNLLLAISRALDVDFFAVYSARLGMAEKAGEGGDQELREGVVRLAGETASFLERMMDYLKRQG